MDDKENKNWSEITDDLKNVRKNHTITKKVLKLLKIYRLDKIF